MDSPIALPTEFDREQFPQEADYLKKQFESDRLLRARTEFHRQFGTNPVTLQEWAISSIKPQQKSQIVDIGCGFGGFVHPLLGYLSDGSIVVGVDISYQMALAARRLMGQTGVVSFVQADAQTLPFEPGVFDIAMANNVLYHINNIRFAIQEAWRLLRPAGKFFAITVGRNYMRELRQLHDQTMLDLGLDWAVGLKAPFDDRFCLENGYQFVASVFVGVRIELYENDLKVNDSSSLSDYYATTYQFQAVVRDPRTPENVRDKVYETFREMAKKQIRRIGMIHISKPMGAFVGEKAQY